MITQQKLLDLFEYDPITGWVINRVDRGSRARKGQRAGTENSNGYRVIYVHGKNIREHRIIWCMVYGQFPVSEIDHIDGIRCNNALENLREATPTQNRYNADHVVGSSGLRGVSPSNSGLKWRARIRVDGQQILLGLFDTAEEAHAAYINAAERVQSKFAYHNRSTTSRRI